MPQHVSNKLVTDYVKDRISNLLSPKKSHSKRKLITVMNLALLTGTDGQTDLDSDEDTIEDPEYQDDVWILGLRMKHI